MTIQQMLLATSSGGETVTLANAGNVNNNPQQKEITISNFISAGGTLIIPSGLYVWSDNTSNPALTVDISCTIINQGIIMGRGGDGGTQGGTNPNTDGGNGGSAIKINSGVTGVTITNESGAFIYGGGGGGGAGWGASTESGGAGGGAGGGLGGRGSFETTSTAGGAIGANGGSSPRPLGGNGGGAGGSGASAQNNSNTSLNGASGAGGGRTTSAGGAIAASGGSNLFGSTGGAGGGTNQAGGNAVSNLGTLQFSMAGGGGGGFGANGGLGSTYGVAGNGGKAIDDSGVTYTLTNNGTIYGAT